MKRAKIKSDPLLIICIVLVMLCLAVFIAYPLLMIAKTSLFAADGSFNPHGYRRILAGGVMLDALKNSLALAVVTAVLSTAIAYAFAYTFAYIRVPLKSLFNAVAILPIISPPFVIALSAILLFGRQGLVSKHLLGLENANIYGFKGLVLVQTLTFFPVAFLVLAGLLRSISPSLEEAGQNLGASKWKTFTTVTLPLTVPGIANAFLLVFVQSLADFGNPMTIGGNYTTVAREVYMQAIGSYDMQAGSALAMLLLTLTFVIYALQKYWVGKKKLRDRHGQAGDRPQDD